MKLHVALNPNCRNKESPEATNTGWINVECDLEYLLNWVGKGLAWAATHFADHYRSGQNAYGSNLIVIDVDGDTTLETFQSTITARQYCYATYTSCSHNPEGEHRFRAIFKMEYKLESTLEHRSAYQWLSERMCTDLGIESFEDNSGAKPERLWYGNTNAVVWTNAEAEPLPMVISTTPIDEGNWDGVVSEANDQELEQCRYLLSTGLIRPSDDGEYDYWAKITAACSSTGEALFEAWQGWCATTHHGTDSSHAEYNCSLNKYRSFSRGSWVTLFAEAKRQHGDGWKKRLFPEHLVDCHVVDPLPDISEMPEYIHARAQAEHDNLEHLAEAVQLAEDTEQLPEDSQTTPDEPFEDAIDRIRDLCAGRDGSVNRQGDFEAINLLMPGIRRNTLTDAIEYQHRTGETRTIQGNYLATLTCHYSVTHNLFIPETRIAAAVEYIATRNQYCPIQTYLKSVEHNDDYGEWDNLGMDLLGISNPLATHALQRFLVGMVARAFNPGCAMDWMPILMGEQGKGKSQFAANLVPQKLFTEMPMSLSKLQTEPYRLHVAWLLELPEVDALFKANMREEFKNLVSTRADSFRRPYDRYPSTLPRKFTFLGTTNAHNFLNDPTGNRRFIPLKLPAGQEVNWRQLPHIRDRLWATALRKYQEGATYIYTSGEIKDMEEYTSQFKVEDTWESEIESYVEGMPHVTVAQVLKGLGLDPAQQSSAHNSRAAEILRKIGWTQKRKRVNGNANATRVWVPPQHVLDAIKNYEETF